MLDDKLCLSSVVEFLHRGHVDRGTRQGKVVVVVVDSSQRKVFISSLSRIAKLRCVKGPGKSRLKLDPSLFNLELFFVRTQKYVDTYFICLSNYITPIRLDYDPKLNTTNEYNHATHVKSTKVVSNHKWMMFSKF